jgi:hypothetical protein
MRKQSFGRDGQAVQANNSLHLANNNKSSARGAASHFLLRFLTEEEMAAQKFAIGESEGLTVEECCDPSIIEKHYLAVGTNFMMHDTGEGAVCLAWVLGDEASFISHYTHEELHRILHKRVGMASCSAYDRVARYVDDRESTPTPVTRLSAQGAAGPPGHRALRRTTA